MKVNCVIYVFLKLYSSYHIYLFAKFFPFTKASVLPNGEALDLNRVPDPTCDNTENNCMAHEPLKRSHGTYDWAFFCHFGKRKVICLLFLFYIF